MTIGQADSVRIAVIGGGAAGMMAAGTAASLGASVTVYEQTGRCGKKLAITGKGRCNVTNLATREEFLENVPRNPRFLYAPLAALTPEDTMTFFESLGVPLKTERGRRVFPESDKAIDIVNAMRAYSSGATVRYEKVTAILKGADGAFLVRASGEERYDRVILATGGRSYPLTGSDGSGHRLAAKLGHTITPLAPSLVPLTSEDKLCPDLQGLSLKNIAIKITDGQKCVYEDFGEMMFAHFGVTGPVILSASAHLAGRDLSSYVLHIDLKPALDEQTLDRRLLADFSERQNKDLINALSALLPVKLHHVFCRSCGIDEHRKVNTLTRAERHTILARLKDLTIPLSGFRPIEEAIVTRGGVDVGQISPKDMQSKLVPGLYFAGEMIDVDAYTGGYNLQIAFSTGYLAGMSAANSL